MNSMVRILVLVWAAATHPAFAEENNLMPPSGVPQLSTGITSCLLGWGCLNGGGSSWTSQYHADWNQVQTETPFNPTEWQIYNRFAIGKAHCVNPGFTGEVESDGGSPFDAGWIGRTAFYMNINQAPAQKVASVSDATHLNLSTNCMGSGSVTFMFGTTTNDGTVNVNGSTVTWVKGQPFNLFVTQPKAWIIDGVAHTCAPVTMSSATCDTTGVMTGVRYHTDLNAYDETATLRLQKVLGGNEENFAIIARAIGQYELRSLVSGNGSYWPVVLGTGTYGARSYSLYSQLVAYPNGNLTLGGANGYEVIQVAPGTAGQASNFLYSQMAPSGFKPGLAARSHTADTNVGLAFDTLGAAATTFTSHAYAATEFEILGGGATAYLAVSSDATSPTLSANSPGASNLNIRLAPKGTGTVLATRPVQLPSYTVANLPPCTIALAGSLAAVSDAKVPAYNAAVIGGGSVHVPVFCDGAIWTAH